MAMTTTTRPQRWAEPDDELTSSFFQQPPSTATPASSPAQGTSDYGTAPKPRPTLQRTAPAVTTQGATAPKGNFDFSTLLGGGGAQLQQRNTAPPLADQSTPAAQAVRITPQNEGQYGVPTEAAARDQFYAQRTQNEPVAGQPGLFWVHDGSGWTVSGTPGAPGGSGPGGGAANPRPSWMTSQPYTPGEIGTDDLNFSWQDLLQEMGPDYQPTNVSGSDYQSRDVDAEDYATYDFGGWSGLPGYDVGAVGEDTDALIRRIIANPESLDALTIDRMKAASREEQSALAGQADEEMRGLGYEMGISDSPWMAAERLQGRRDRDAAVIAGNRGIDIEAAKTNAGDRRAAGTLAASYVDSKGRLKLAQRQQEFSEQSEGEKNKQASTASKQARAEYLTGVKTGNADRALEAAKLRTQADVANNQNLFNSAKLRQDRVLGTVDADLKRAAATTDRLSLREQASQAAAELGISRDKLMSDWLQALMDDATQRYGIDIAATVDREKLAQAGAEFKENLAFQIMALDKEMGFKYAQLGESGRQFDYNYGLSAAGLQENARQHDDDMHARSQGF